MIKFKSLSVEKRLKVVYELFSFFNEFINKNYVAVDFYDSSLIYDFENDNVTFCDIDLFRKMPIYNVLLKATKYNRNERYATIKEFETDFIKSLNIENRT